MLFLTGLVSETLVPHILRNAVAIAVVVIIILVTVINNARRAEAFLAGVWEGTPEFLERAGLGSMHLFISRRNADGRAGYLVMTDAAGATVVNRDVEVLEAGFLRRLLSVVFHRHDFAVPGFGLRSDAGELPLPATGLRASVSYADGTLTIYDDEKVWAHLAKDNMSSYAALLEFESLGKD
jgi:hypothetical protein